MSESKVIDNDNDNNANNDNDKINSNDESLLLSYINEETGVRNFTNDMAGRTIFIDKIALEDAIKFQEIEFEIIRGYCFNEGFNNNINDVIQEIFEERKKLKAEGLDIPLVGDFHYNGHLLLDKFPACAQALAKYRINPGNVGYGEKHEYNFETIVKIAKANDKPIRIGVNWGSLDQDLLTEFMDLNSKAKLSRKFKELSTNSFVFEDINQELNYKEVMYLCMIESALRSAELAMKTGLAEDRIIVSTKMSELQDLINVYRLIAKACKFPLHLGLTEAGTPIKGMIASSAALGILLQAGIGDTIRMSLTPGVGDSSNPLNDRTLEVRACQELLQALELAYYKPSVTSCPGCGRTSSTYFQLLAQEINEYILLSMPEWKKKFPGVEKLKIAVMGCIVNGPGESKHADIGISLPGDNEEPVAPVYINGELTQTLRGENISKEFKNILLGFIEEKFCVKIAN
jgi:(E)-4-hydroxy-3-methylbut-2-enyl-diphosphate synthase